MVSYVLVIVACIGAPCPFVWHHQIKVGSSLHHNILWLWHYGSLYLQRGMEVPPTKFCVVARHPTNSMWIGRFGEPRCVTTLLLCRECDWASRCCRGSFALIWGMGRPSSSGMTTGRDMADYAGCSLASTNYPRIRGFQCGRLGMMPGPRLCPRHCQTSGWPALDRGSPRYCQAARASWWSAPDGGSPGRVGVERSLLLCLGCISTSSGPEGIKGPAHLTTVPFGVEASPPFEDQSFRLAPCMTALDDFLSPKELS